MLALICVIVGIEREPEFLIDIDEQKTVNGLKDAIKERKRDKIACDSSDLKLHLATKNNAWLSSRDGDVEDLRKGEISDSTKAYFALEMEVEASVRDLIDESNLPDPSTRQIHVLVTIPGSREAKPRWKAAKLVLNEDALYFVNRDQAVDDLCRVHRSVFIGAKNNVRADLWPIVLADSDGLGKTAFGRHYIQRCREQWPERVEPPNGFRESLCACRTIVVAVERKAFVNAVVSRDTERTTIAMVMSKTINAALAKAVIAQLELPDGAQPPAHLSSPKAIPYTDLVKAVVKDLGPVLIVLDEVDRGFQYGKDAGPHADAEEESFELFFEFCSSVLAAWMNTKDVYFVLMGDARFLRNVGERIGHRPLALSPYKFIRLSL